MALLGKGVEHAQTLYYAQAHPARMRSPLLLTTFNTIKLHEEWPSSNNNNGQSGAYLRKCLWNKQLFVYPPQADKQF